ncbi:hypothetical protein GCM10009546_27090 [Actinomadura livida]|uniref:Uncharacterized protein n=1 Tax=Actinomadura livida TaxID=79909 RepID=A0ABP3PCV8_9ACTN|nr:hypothetical protein GCM10010208_36770 [Actinomadura livida]
MVNALRTSPYSCFTHWDDSATKDPTRSSSRRRKGFRPAAPGVRAARADQMVGRDLSGLTLVERAHIEWHAKQVFRGAARAA